jgi:hypothetical protein
MPWNSQSGGGRRGQQPDLEELLKRSREGLKQVIPGGAGPPGLLVFLGLLGAALLTAYFAYVSARSTARFHRGCTSVCHTRSRR